MKRFRPSATEVICILIIAWLLLCAVVPGLVASGDPLAIHPREAFEAPSFAHWFGTDESGRDLYTRVVHGAGPSLVIGVSATAIGMVLATVLGAAAGLGPRWLDFGSTRVVEVMFAFPGLLLALLFIVVYGPGIVTSTIAVGLATAPGYARIIRSQMLSVRGAPFVEAALVLGRTPWWRLSRAILPNVGGTLFVLVTLGVGQSIVWASSLSYLGLGAQPPTAEWGAMLSAGRTYIDTAWWMTFFPGLVIVLSAATATVLGRSLQSRTRNS
ncbi:ABC transporter permease [Leifsonia sp. Root112D2]|uniref:ABC transporter permease n=1 Tax=Leifsonia sp. Root112D2 TaxID=1736426 RepID=UPI000A487496|nr:ABC transporter permease [Leifsonia sp. Root112D2]